MPLSAPLMRIVMRLVACFLKKTNGLDYAQKRISTLDQGNSYFSSGEYWKASEAYLPALRLHSEYAWKSKEREWFEARINLAITYSIIGNRLGVLGIFASEIVDSPSTGDDLMAHIKSSKAEVYLFLGEAYLQVANRPEKRTVYLTAAVGSFKHAIDIAPKVCGSIHIPG